MVADSFGSVDKSKVLRVLASLPDGRAVVRLRSGFGERPVPPFEISTLKPPTKKHNFTEGLINMMRRLYSVPKLPQQTSSKSELGRAIIELLRTVHSLEDKGEETTRSNISKSVSVPGSKLSEQLDIAQSKGLIERIVKKEGKGRPKVLTKLTEKGLNAIGIGVSSGSSSKAGGELHRALLFKAKEWLEGQGYYVKIPEQAGRAEQPDMLAYPKVSDGLGSEIAVEIETSVNHPEQVVRNYEKNAKLGRFVIFVVPDEEVENKIEECLKNFGKKKFSVYILGNII